jgi:hypothetical protein
MADGDIRVHRSFGSLRTTAGDGSTYYTMTLVPTVPAIADDQHYCVHALVWRLEEAYKDSVSGPALKLMEQYVMAQDNGTYVWYDSSAVNDLLTPPIGETTDTFTGDFSGSSYRLRVKPNGGGGFRRWFAVVTLYRGDHVVA